MRLRIDTSDQRLHRALSDLLAGTPEGDGTGRTVVVAPAGDCPSDRCAALTAAGCRVIILAPIPRADDQARYAAAGAFAYLPMSIDARSLRSTVRAALQPGIADIAPCAGWS